MAKNTVILYTEWMEQIQELSLEERGIILTAILNYQAGEELPKMDRMLKLVFIPIRQNIDRDNEAYVRKCEKNRENINKRWNTIEYERIRSDTKHTDNDNENDNDKDNENDNDKDKDNENDNELINDSSCSSKTNQPAAVPESDPKFNDQLRQKWNRLPNTQSIGPIAYMSKRDEELRKCLLAFGPDEVMRSIDKIAGSKWLSQRKNISWDSYMNVNAMQKLLGGEYDEVYEREVKRDIGQIWDFKIAPDD